MEQRDRVPDGTLSNQHNPYNVPDKDRQGPRDPVLVGGRMAKYQEAASVLIGLLDDYAAVAHGVGGINFQGLGLRA